MTNNHTETAIVAGSGSINTSSTKDPIKEPPKSYAFSWQFLYRCKKSKSETGSSLDKMINMIGIQMQQYFAMGNKEMRNDRQLHCQELAMQQQMPQLQQQMMNIFML